MSAVAGMFVERPAVPRLHWTVTRGLLLGAVAAFASAVVLLATSRSPAVAVLLGCLFGAHGLGLWVRERFIRYTVTPEALLVRAPFMTWSVERGQLRALRRRSAAFRSLALLPLRGEAHLGPGTVIVVEAPMIRVSISPRDPEAFIARLGHLWDPAVPLERRRIT